MRCFDRAAVLAVLALAVLAGACHRTTPVPHPPGVPVLRAVWRDATHHLLVAMPADRSALPRGDCTAPLLINDADGGVRAVSRTEAAQWMAHMQLAGATEGRCPK
jgi:hypothetical protein